MFNLLCALSLALVVSMFPAVASAEPSGGSYEVYVVGDSTAYRAEDKMRKMHPGWTWKYDAVRGTRVDTLTDRVLALREAHGPAPEVLVIALGTNPAAGWRCRDYADARWKVWRRTRVVFVAPYVTAEDNTRARVRRTSRYARCMNRLDERLPNTEVAYWRRRAIRNPQGLLLADGVHQTPSRGERVWSRVVAGAAQR